MGYHYAATRRCRDATPFEIWRESPLPPLLPLPTIERGDGGDGGWNGMTIYFPFQDWGLISWISRFSFIFIRRSSLFFNPIYFHHHHRLTTDFIIIITTTGHHHDDLIDVTRCFAPRACCRCCQRLFTPSRHYRAMRQRHLLIIIYLFSRAIYRHYAFIFHAIITPLLIIYHVLLLQIYQTFATGHCRQNKRDFSL